MKEDLIKIVGKENVSFEEARLESYGRDHSFAKGIKPCSVVRPSNVEQVRNLVQWANKTKTPLVPVSSGGNHYKGDTVPSMPQAVVVDLSGMNRIISINRQERMAVVEPGVTYGELQQALEKEGLTLSTSLAPKAEKSVLTSVLEVEPRLNANHQWSYIDPLRCMEVTWGDGNTMFTGEAGGGAKDLLNQWDAGKWQVNGNGPNAFDFIRTLTSAQGSMGIVTWASLRCEVLPTIHKMFMVPADRMEKLIDFVYRVLRLRFSDELMIVNKAYLACLTGETSGQIQEMMEDLPEWATLVGILGRELLPEKRVTGQEQDIEEIAQQNGLKMLKALPHLSGEKLLEKTTKPSSKGYWKEIYKGAFQDIFFITTLDKTPIFIDAIYSLAKEIGYQTSDIGIYIQPQHCGTSVHLEFSFPYDPRYAKEAELVKKIYVKGSEKVASLGAYFARPYDIWSHIQMNKDAQSYSILKKLKEIFDPNNIMNTGKLTI